MRRRPRSQPSWFTPPSASRAHGHLGAALGEQPARAVHAAVCVTALRALPHSRAAGGPAFNRSVISLALIALGSFTSDNVVRAGIVRAGCAASFIVLRKRGEEDVMADNQSKKCAHPGCNCSAAKNSKYCGTYCEGAAQRPSIACGCGHPECSEPAGVRGS